MFDQEREIEFDRQLSNLIEKGYPALAGLRIEEFLAIVEPLRVHLPDVIAGKRAHIPFIIVITSEIVIPERAMTLVSVDGKKGSVAMTPVSPDEFTTIPDVSLPDPSAYLLCDISTGKSTLNVTPNDALKVILQDRRTPLTIDEGVSLMLQYPEILRTHNAFSLLGSRGSDKRVPAMWISYGKPRLGWCWAGNPHTWLGSASAGMRL